jgi:hypothetical protein
MSRLGAALCVWVASSGSAHAASHAIGGRVVDRNGEPLSRAVVSLAPGNVELVTDRDGRFVIDYLRDQSGERIKLGKKTEYTLEVFKAGFHTFKLPVSYKRGALEVETVTMVEETIDVQDFPENLDPALYNSPTQSAGATYEGQ